AKEFDQNQTPYFPPPMIKQMERAGLTMRLNDFFATLLKENPESPFWSEYVRVAAHAGHADDALTLVRTTSERRDLSPARRAELRNLLPTALLANDEVEAGIGELRRSLTNQQPASRSGDSYYSYSFGGLGQPALAMAGIGKLLDQKEGLEEGIAVARKQLEDEPDAERDAWSHPEQVLADMLSELGRGPEAEDVLLQALRKA